MLNKVMNKKNKDSESGFTIIEVLIVLAIAGLILVVVLIAIPQLQRNQRNTARQNDAARVASSVSNFIANNNGRIPASTDLPAIARDLGDLSQYTITDTGGGLVIVNGEQSPDTSLTELTIVVAGDCAGDGEGDPGQVLDGTPRQLAIQYATETNAGGTTGNAACLDV